MKVTYKYWLHTAFRGSKILVSTQTFTQNDSHNNTLSIYSYSVHRQQSSIPKENVPSVTLYLRKQICRYLNFNGYRDNDEIGFSEWELLYIYWLPNTWLFELIVGSDHLVLQMQPHVISFYGVTSRIRFMFLLFPQVSRNCRYESDPPVIPSPLTCYRQFGTNSITVLMFVESQRVQI